MKTMLFSGRIRHTIFIKQLVVDRPRNTCHYKYSNLIYPVDYGYLCDTTGSDQAPIDVFKGSEKSNLVQSVVVSADILKKRL